MNKRIAVFEQKFTKEKDTRICAIRTNLYREQQQKKRFKKKEEQQVTGLSETIPKLVTEKANMAALEIRKTKFKEMQKLQEDNATTIRKRRKKKSHH